MPRAPGFRTAAMERLLQELQFAPRETQLRIAESAEMLVRDIDAEGRYPDDFVVFRLTGYRPGRSDDLLAGKDLLADLPALIVHFSARAGLLANEVRREPLEMKDVADLLGVSERSLRRYRAQGMVCHMLREAPSDRPKLICFRDAIESFRDTHRAMLADARAFTRLGAETEHLVERRAAELAAEGCTMGQSVRSIAEELGRAPETIRRHVSSFDRRTGVFGEYGRLADREAELIDRARRAGVSLRRMAERFGRTVATIRRSALRARAEWLRKHRPDHAALPTFELVDAPSVILGAAPVREGLDRLLPRDEAITLLAAADAAPAPAENDVAALLAAFHLLKRESAREIDALAPWPSARAVDRIEVMLRHTLQLHRRLLTLLLPVVVQRLRTGGNVQPEILPREELRSVILRSVRLVTQEIDRVDAMRAARLARRIAFVSDLHAAHESALMRERVGRAAARRGPGSVPLIDPFEGLLPWDRRLSLPGSLVGLVDRLPEQEAALIRAHYGLGSAPAETLLGLAEQRGTTESAIARSIERSLVELRALRQAER